MDGYKKGGELAPSDEQHCWLCCVNEFCGRVRFGNDRRILGSYVDIGLKTELHLRK